MKCIYSALLAILILPTTASAMDIDEHCTVNIMNRTVQVQTDGTWRMNNVPSFMGRVRARATCVNDGKTTSGQSEFFSLSTNNLTVVEDIFFDDPSPVPVSLSFSQSADISFQDVNESSSLAVRATYSDGTVSPVLNASNGINFVSSNAAIVAVDANGALTPVSSGRALITARLEGTVAVKQVTVMLSGDMDGDGLPDSYEIANGLDPNDPVDALEDTDKDGLNSLQEFTAGTEINNDDTDNDGISDGEELVAGLDGYITNPLLADTDGDGFSDGLEVELATDPSDSNSFDLVNAMESITVTPSTLKLIFNGVDTEVSDHITVIANLIDGGEKDITTDSDTSYSSSNLSIASFSTTPGEVFGGIAGTAIVTVSNNGYSDTVSVEVERFSPIALSAVDIPGYANNVDVQGDYAYVAAGAAGLVIVDVSDRASPVVISELDTDGTSIDVKVYGDIVYLADGEAGIKIIDVSDVNTPILLSRLDTEGFSQNIDADNSFLYVADGDNGVVIVNISDTEQPFVASTLSSIGRAKGISVENLDLAIVTTSELVLVDIVNAQSPVIVSRVSVSRSKAVLLQGEHTYISTLNTYQVFNVSDLFNPLAVSAEGNIFPRDAVANGDLVLFADQRFPNAVAYMSKAVPDNIRFQGIVDFTSLGANYNGTGIAADNQYVYTTKDSAASLNEYGITGSTKLFIGQYKRVVDERGLAPAINILSPTTDDTIVQGSVMSMEVSAQDDVEIQKVIFSLNEQEVFSDTQPPYILRLSIPSDATELLLSARAVDWGENESSIDLTVLPQLDTDQDGLGDEDELNIYLSDPNNPDSDGDGLSDYRETLVGTDVNKIDTDEDGIGDGDEFYSVTSPLLSDTDYDGLSDSEEQTLGSNPTESDSDKDGLRDDDELRFGSDPLKRDTDDDGLFDGDEVKVYFTSPINIDTDADNANDGGEVLIGSNPLVAEVDSDNDKISNEREVEIGTNPTNPDTDGDTLLDGDEIINHTNPLAVDTDKDGLRDDIDVFNEWIRFFEIDADDSQNSIVSVGDINNDGKNDIAVQKYNTIKIISSVNGEELHVFNGKAVDYLGDVNDDGYDDVLVAHGYTSPGSGAVLIYSGKDGSLIHELTSESLIFFGSSVAGLGDLDGDFIPDLVVTGVADNNEYQTIAYSGKDASLIYRLSGPGGLMKNAGDVNNDGVNDLVFKGVLNKITSAIRSGIDGSILYEFEAPASTISSLGDVNGDGFADVAFGFSHINEPRVDIISGVDGSLMHSIVDEGGYGNQSTFFGFTISSAGDINQDGYFDILIGSKGYKEQYLQHSIPINNGRVQVFSGFTGREILSIKGNSRQHYDNNASMGELLGGTVIYLGDIDNDDYGEFAVTAKASKSLRIISANKDWDGDGFLTYQDPYPVIYMDEETDYDNDGLLDFEELNGVTDVLNADTDGDGLNDSEEVKIYLTNPLLADSDGDELPDIYEVSFGLNPNIGDAQEDLDNDNLSNLQEYIYGTEVNNADSDSDSVSDGDEITNRTNPFLIDTDGDGLTDDDDEINDWYYFFNSDALNDGFGTSITSISDMNNNGKRKIVVGAPAYLVDDYRRGIARVFNGDNSLEYYDLDADFINQYRHHSGFPRHGQLVENIGDINGDAIDDVAVGAPSAKVSSHNSANGGAVNVFSGSDGNRLYTLNGPIEGYFGSSIDGNMDFNGDGIPDMLVGAPTPFSQGRAILFSGDDGSSIKQLYSSDLRDRFGHAVSTIGDLNNDNFPEFIVGAPASDKNGTSSGLVKVFSGSDFTLLYSIEGESESDQFGYSIDNIKDLNNDGVEDFIVGSPFNDANGTDSGKVVVLSGADGAVIYILNGELDGEQFGTKVSRAGDINNDGLEDFLVGSPLADTNGIDSGMVRAFSGKDGSLVFSLSGYKANDQLGISVAGFGDIDGDGFDEVIVGAINSVRVLSVNQDWDNDGLVTLNDPYANIYMDETTDYDNDGLLDFEEIILGTNAMFPDTDKDGLTDNEEVNTYFSNPFLKDSDSDGIPDRYEVDNALNLIDAEDKNLDNDADGLDNFLEYSLGLLAGSIDSDEDGLADGIEYFSNKTSPLIADTDRDGVIDGLDNINSWHYLSFNDDPENNFGFPLTGVGDVNNDSYIDFIVGSPGKDSNGINSGEVNVFSGADNSVIYTIKGETEVTFHGAYLSDYFGTSVSDIGDLNNDGFSDFMVGSPYENYKKGAVRVFSGIDGSTLFTLNGSSNSGYFGNSIANAGDVNADGVNDIVVGAPQTDNTSSNSGSAIIFSGVDISVLYTFNGNVSNELFGSFVSGAGDVNNDGFADVSINSSSPKKSTVFSGANGSILYTFDNPVKSAGDINNDGYSDFAIGYPTDSTYARYAGKVDVLSGLDGSELYSIFGSSVGGLFGSSITGGSDINNDGHDDIIVGAAYDPSNGYRSGSVSAISGVDGSILYTAYGYSAHQRFGSYISHIGDVDKDGYSDIIAADDAGHIRVISSNGDWDNDGVGTLNDSEPLNPAVQ